MHLFIFTSEPEFREHFMTLWFVFLDTSCVKDFNLRSEGLQTNFKPRVRQIEGFAWVTFQKVKL